MQKIDTIDDSFYNHLFEKLEVYTLDEYSDNEDLEKLTALELLSETILCDTKNLLEEEIANAEPVFETDDTEAHITRLSILNTIINAIIPGHRLVLEVDEKKEKILAAYIATV